MIRTHTCGELRKEHVGKEVTLAGWVDTYRVAGQISFLLLRDRTGITQIFVNKDLTEKLQDLKKESVVKIVGVVNARPDKQIKKEMMTGEIELEAKQAEIVSMAEVPLPIELTAETTTGIDKRLDYRFLDLRREKVRAIFTVRAKLYAHTVSYFNQAGFIGIQSPKITASGVESGAEEFKFEYFGKPAALAQSPQVYKQMGVVSGLERVYEIGPVFRAENSHTTRHVTEFTGLDMEMGFIESEHDVMDVLEKYFQFLVPAIKKDCQRELEILGVELRDVPEKIPRISLKKAVKTLAEKGKTVPDKEDLDPEGERMMCAYVQEKFKSDFVFMLDYPWEKRPFYHMRPEDKTVTKSFDLLYNGVEIATGAQREHRLDVLKEQAKEKGIEIEKMDFYSNIFRYGAPPHGGAGLGFDRILSLMLNLGNVKEGIFLPRDPDRLIP
jgi:nondiscriminating aspartyl-tRNA synthetase